ncbi:hypothetical protein LEP1GSC058_1715 [Leptospira fainei serovar Hurstbridge str. BUT 6]|uniref:Uncharacterized protein n=1 Tax=Leptospira fainei serovar Hurstbridge str. BUT 6 TaxID=1193011 RepID=S3UZS3_9LEPT|nr:hypothetical protein [Leptospira fainei]EPG74723.1 hypothetical protein LEP1GSC058_1715 [Leptospira fainei serovar Hurstbridge str. BUT 6]
MKFLFFLLLSYLVFRFVQRAFTPIRKEERSGFKVIFPDARHAGREKDISDKVRILEKEDSENR